MKRLQVTIIRLVPFIRFHDKCWVKGNTLARLTTGYEYSEVTLSYVTAKVTREKHAHQTGQNPFCPLRYLNYSAEKSLIQYI